MTKIEINLKFKFPTKIRMRVKSTRISYTTDQCYNFLMVFQAKLRHGNDQKINKNLIKKKELLLDRH